jgi:hypothetical protein
MVGHVVCGLKKGKQEPDKDCFNGPKAQRSRLRTSNVPANSVVPLKKGPFDKQKMCTFGRFGKLIEEREMFMLNELPALEIGGNKQSARACGKANCMQCSA